MIYQKDPAAILDYEIDWSAWLANGEVITASSFTADAGLTIVSTANGDKAATVWLSGGVAGVKYRVGNTVTTSQGRTDERSITIWAVTR